MIQIDNRVGSKDLYPFLSDLSELSRLEFGDACWIGNGVDANGEEEPVTIGIERKNINDLIQSIESRRLGGFQLDGLLRTYQVNYLVIEGVWKNRDDGALETYQRGYWKTSTRPGGKTHHYGEVSNFINSMTIVSGFHIRQTSSPKETAFFLRHLYNWWQKPWHTHNSHKVIYSTQVGMGTRCKPKLVVPMSRQQQVLMKMLAQVSGLEQKARDLALNFNSVMEMVVLSEKDWMKYKGIGKVLAGNLVKIFQGL